LIAKRTVVDSSVWIELMTMGKKHPQCRRAIEGSEEILVPTLVFYEVYKKIATQASEEDGLAVVGEMGRHRVMPLDRTVALLAADISREHRLGMADSMVLAHARAADAALVTLDNDFAQFSEARVVR
jgi:toxin FitB